MTATTARNRMLGHVISAEQFDRELLDVICSARHRPGRGA